MKKILCVLMAVTAIGFCFAGCVDHNDGVCDKCDKTIGVVRYDADHELCLEHMAEWKKSEAEKK